MYQRQYILGRGTVDVTSNYATYKTMDGRIKELYDTSNINLIIYFF